MTESKTPRPRFRDLANDEARAFLAGQHVARLAYTFRDRVDIEPLHYVANGDWVYGRTSSGSKLSTLAHHRWCALEVDQIHGTFDWISVVVKGAFTVVDPDVDRAVFPHALELLRGLMPAALLPDDPVPERTVLFRIHIAEITGRSAQSG